VLENSYYRRFLIFIKSIGKKAAIKEHKDKNINSI
jgi:hypothetical protein